jgi:hypothetical protein
MASRFLRNSKENGTERETTFAFTGAMQSTDWVVFSSHNYRGNSSVGFGGRYVGADHSPLWPDAAIVWQTMKPTPRLRNDVSPPTTFRFFYLRIRVHRHKVKQQDKKMWKLARFSERSPQLCNVC